jgi:hypothetical protein
MWKISKGIRCFDVGRIGEARGTVVALTFVSRNGGSSTHYIQIDELEQAAVAPCIIR